MQGRKIKDEEHSWKDEEVTLRDFTKGLSHMSVFLLR